MEDILRAIVLGIVQGLTEFLPISSSGHLIITREAFGWDFADDLTFDVALHMGTLVAVLAYFWSEWQSMLSSVISLLPGRQSERIVGQVYDARLFLLIIIGSIPAAVLGLFADKWAEDELRTAAVVGVSMIAGGLVLYTAERLGRRSRRIESARVRDSLFIGGAQALSLIPGISRSGATISAGLFDNFERPDAARLSFLLAAPVTAGAGLFKLKDAATGGVSSSDIVPMIVGTITAGIVGWLAIRFLLRFVQTRSYLPFVIYRLVVGSLVLLFLAT